MKHEYDEVEIPARTEKVVNLTLTYEDIDKLTDVFEDHDVDQEDYAIVKQLYNIWKEMAPGT